MQKITVIAYGDYGDGIISALKAYVKIQHLKRSIDSP